MDIAPEVRAQILAESHFAHNLAFACAAVVNWTFKGVTIPEAEMKAGLREMEIDEDLWPDNFKGLTLSKVFRLRARGMRYSYEIEDVGSCTLSLTHLTTCDKSLPEFVQRDGRRSKARWRSYAVNSQRPDGKLLRVGTWSLEPGGEMQHSYAKAGVEEEDCDALDGMIKGFKEDAAAQVGALDGNAFNEVMSHVLAQMGGVPWFGGTCYLIPNQDKGSAPELDDDLMLLQRVCEIIHSKWRSSVDIDLSYIYDDRILGASGRWMRARDTAKGHLSLAVLKHLGNVERLLAQLREPSSNLTGQLISRSKELEAASQIWESALGDDWFGEARSALATARELINTRIETGQKVALSEVLHHFYEIS